MAKSNDTFSDLISSQPIEPRPPERESSAFPQTGSNTPVDAKPKWAVKYGVFDLGSTDEILLLEEIQNKHLANLCRVMDERVITTKAGDVKIFLKYAVPVNDIQTLADESASILGRRRIRKALRQHPQDTD